MGQLPGTGNHPVYEMRASCPNCGGPHLIIALLAGRDPGNQQ